MGDLPQYFKFVRWMLTSSLKWHLFVVSSCTGTQRNETLTNCVTTPCMDMKTIGIPPCTGTPGQSPFIVTFSCSKLRDLNTALLPGMKFTIIFKCEKLSPKIFTGEVDLYPVGFRELDHCDARQGYLLGTLSCGHTKSFNASHFSIKDVEVYKILGKCNI